MEEIKFIKRDTKEEEKGKSEKTSSNISNPNETARITSHTSISSEEIAEERNNFMEAFLKNRNRKN